MSPDSGYEDTITRIAAVHMLGRLEARRRRTQTRIDGFASKYAPILAKLSETEFCGLIQALSDEGRRREADGGRPDRAMQLARENP